MNKKIKSALVYSAAVAGALFAGVESAWAGTFKDASNKVHDQFQGAADLISGGSYIAGAAFGVQAAMKLREHSENPQQTRLSKPLTFGVVSGALLALPSFLSVGTESMGFEQKNSLTKGTLGR